jgi:cysteine synthase B
MTTTLAPVSSQIALPAAALAIGNTPLLPIQRFATEHGLPEHHELWLKAEWTNPGGSVKDRPALAIVREARSTGILSEGKTLLDASSGNTGISYAMLGAAFGFPVEIVLPGSASEERRQILRAFGATIIESDPLEGSNGAILLARKRFAENLDRYFYADQYSNPANPRAHYETTGPEIWEGTGGRVTDFVAGLGTTGTLIGTGRYLREQNSAVRLVAIQPADSFHGLEGLKHLPTAIVPEIYDASVPDVQIGVETDTAYDIARSLARTEGLFTGISTGAALAGALVHARSLEPNQPRTIVVIAPDSGSKYLSTGLFA